MNQFLVNIGYHVARTITAIREPLRRGQLAFTNDHDPDDANYFEEDRLAERYPSPQHSAKQYRAGN